VNIPLRWPRFLLLVSGVGGISQAGFGTLPEDPCSGLARGDTLRFTGVERSTSRAPMGDYRMWSDSAGRVSYAESWRIDTTTYRWDGQIRLDDRGWPRAYVARRFTNGRPNGLDSVYVAGDSAITVRNGQRTGQRLEPGVSPAPSFRASASLAVLSQCVLRQENRQLRMARLGLLTLRHIVTDTIRLNGSPREISLHLLTSDSIPELVRVWLDRGRLFAVAMSEGVMDLVREEWVSAVPQLLKAELSAAGRSETCAAGGGPGSCEDSEYVCKVTGPSGRGGTMTISDSGYSVRSDGLGPYASGTSNVNLVAGGTASMLLSRPRPGAPPRSFSIDLSHPVPGDLGVPLGTVLVNGVISGYQPSGALYRNEIGAQWYTEKDTVQHSVLEIPVGTTVETPQIAMDFYVDGVMHVLQVGPQPYGHCMAAGTAIYGSGTSRGTITRPLPNRWIVELPPGSIGRLFENRHGDPSAVNKGLYYISLRFVLQQ